MAGFTSNNALVVRYSSVSLCSLKAHNMMSVPLSIMLKSAAVLKEDELTSAAAVAWEFLLQSDKEIVATAGKFKVYLCNSG